VDTVGKRGKQGRRFLHSKAETQEAVKKWVAGETLTRKQQEIVDFMRDVAEQRRADDAEAADRYARAEDAIDAREEREAMQAAERIAEADDVLNARPMSDAEVEAFFRGDGNESEGSIGQPAARDQAVSSGAGKGDIEGARSGDAEAQPPILERPTADDIRARDDAARAADEQRRADERKSDVDAEPFVMTGSNRPVDQAEARGQRSLLDEPARQESQQNVDNQPAAPKIEDMPERFMQTLKVDAYVYDADAKKWNKESVPVREAMDAVNDDVALYRRLIDCLRR
jgi:hypothetical protein